MTIILPALIQEGIYLAVSGLSSGYVVHGVLERLLYMVPMVTVAAAFASLWRNYSRWAGGLALAIAGTYGTIGLLFLLDYLLGSPELLPRGSGVPGVSRFLAAFYGAGLCLAVLAIGHARRAWGPGRCWLGLASAILVFIMLNQYWPVNFFPVRPADPAAARAVLGQAPLKISLQDIHLTQIFGKQWNDGLDFGVNVSSHSDEAVLPNVVKWSGHGARLINAAGQDFPAVTTPDYASAYDAFLANSSGTSLADLKSWGKFLPPGAFFRLNQNNYVPASSTYSLGEFNLSHSESWLNGPVSLKARLKGRVYRWDRVADMAINGPASVKNDHESWSYDGVIRRDNMSRVNLILKLSQVGFATTTDARTTPFSGLEGPRERYGFVLYNPGRQIALLGYSYINQVASRAGSTALAEYWLDLLYFQFGNDWKPLNQDEMAQCHLFIFQKTWLDTVPADWQSPDFAINDLMNPPNVSGNGNQEGLSPSELERRVGEIPLPGPSASRPEVCRYLMQVLPIVDASRYSRPPGEAVIARLATLVPEHLDVILDGLPGTGYAAFTTLIQAIIRGADESQKERIFASLPGAPYLMEVILKRGWVAEGHDAIYKLMDSPRPLSLQEMQAIATFQDPETYPRLLAEFKSSPQMEKYDLLRTLPGLAEPLAAEVSQLWQDQCQVVAYDLSDWQPALRLALHTGNTDALRFAYRLLAESETKQNPGYDNWALAQVFRDNVKMSRGNEAEDLDNNQFLDRLRHYRPDAFSFDPVRHCFVLKAGSSASLAAASGH